jgi:hypothetical protein
MTLGLGAKASKPAVVTVNETEILITKDSEGRIPCTNAHYLLYQTRDFS